MQQFEGVHFQILGQVWTNSVSMATCFDFNANNWICASGFFSTATAAEDNVCCNI